MFISKGYKGNYYLYFTNPSTGKRTKLTTRKTTKRDAKVFLKSFIERFNNSDGLHSQMNFEVSTIIDFQKVYLEHAAFNLAPKTVLVVKRSFSNLIKHLGNRNLSTIRFGDIEHFKICRVREVSKTSVNMEVRAIKSFLNYANKMGYIISNPSKGIKLFSVEEREKLCFSDSDLFYLLNSIDLPMFKNLVLFGLYTGCRISEIINVQLSDLDLTNRVLTIRNKNNFKTKTGKNRQIPISDLLCKIIKNQCEIKIYPENYEYLFSLKLQQRLRDDYVTHKFKKYLRKASLPEKFHFHCLRHTFITNLIKQGVPINFVKELAGHSNIQTTMNYIHIETNDLRQAVNGLKFG